MIGLIGAVSRLPAADGSFQSRANRFLQALDCESTIRTGGLIAGSLDPPYARTTSRFEAEDGTIVLVNGHHYNGQQATAGEQAYRAFQARGPDAFSDLNGSIVCLIHRPDTNETWIAVDRLASWPVLYAATDRVTYFAPVLQPFNQAEGVSRALNDAGLASMFANGHMLGADTYYRDVRSVLPGNYLHMTHDAIEEREYWRYNAGQDLNDEDPESIKRTYRDLLMQAMERRFLRHPDAPLLMSGGADSRVILGCCLELGYKPKLMSYAVNAKPGTDTDIAKRIAAQTGCAFEHLPFCVDDISGYIQRSTAPFSGMRGSIYEFQALDRLAGHCDAVWLGDESFGWDAHALADEDDVFSAIGIRPFESHACWRTLLKPEFYDRLKMADCENRAQVSELCTFNELHDRKDFFYTMLRLPRNILLGRRYLAAHVATPLAPWLDNDLVDFVGRLPIPHRLGKQLFREVARESFPEMFNVEQAHASGMPDDFTWFRQAQAVNTALMEKACSDEGGPIDSQLDLQAFHDYFEHARPSFAQQMRNAIVQSPAANLARTAMDISNRIRKMSKRVARQRARAGVALTPRHVFERVAQIRLYASEADDWR